jgi:hypothetical protein
MKKIISLIMVFCLLLSMNIMFADHKDSSSKVKYDIDDFSSYLIKNNDGKNTKDIIEDYFKDKTNDNNDFAAITNSENFTETTTINGKEVKTSKVIKKVKISDTQDITFYENGYFGIGEKIINETEQSTLMGTLGSTYTSWGQYQYDAYNGAGAWMGAALVGQSFIYNYEFVGLNAAPTGNSSYNSTLYSKVSSKVGTNFPVGQMTYGFVRSFSSITIKPRVLGTNMVIVANIEGASDGSWDGYGGVGEY